MIRIVLVAVLFLLTNSIEAAAGRLPKHQPTPGGVAIVELGSSVRPAPKVQYNTKPVLTLEFQNKWIAVIGIPLQSKIGQHHILVQQHGTNDWQVKQFSVKNKIYPEQRIKISSKQALDPSPDNMKKIRTDRMLIAKAKSHWSDTVIATSFRLPVDGARGSEFGLQQFFDDKPRPPHGGLDIEAPEGTPVYAPADGTVIESKSFFYSGNCIFVDHGQGLQTFYAHLGKRDVEPGDVIKKGQKIAEVGKTGRVTVPHLHWSVGLNQTWVDPNLFLE